MKSHHTLQQYARSMDWYENTFQTALHDDTAGNIIKNVCEWAIDKANGISATSKRG
jgi:hydrogenase maturation factor